MVVCDFSRSFITFVTPGKENSARIQVEALCELAGRDGPREVFALVASCKAEDTYGAGQLFREPNYDFCAIFSPDRYRIIRTHITWHEAAQESGPIQPRFERVQWALSQQTGQACAGATEIIAATLEAAPLVGVTEITDSESGVSATLQYPVKTINVNGQREVWQVDTGPVLLPDLTATGAQEAIAGLSLAYVAYSDLERAEFIVAEPVALPGLAQSISHYNAIRRLPARNRIVRL